MARILFFLFLAFLVWLAVRVLGGSRRDDPVATAEPSRPAAQPGIEAVTQCAWCGVHVPRGEAVSLPDGRIYCSDAHREAAREAAREGVASTDRGRS